MDQTQTPSEHPKLDALIAGYLEAVERGETPDRNQIIAENPDLATELRAFFDDLDRVQRAAALSPDAPAPPKPDAAHASTVIRRNHEPTPGIIIAGRYKLLENIGEGGMGSVWVAEQLKPVKRKVAIKLIKPGMDSKQVLARFEAERQALAVMDHPNIAKVFDGGLTEQGRPYFVMEYVKGVPFTDYCDRARLPLKDRLSLFIAVCSAVQHAHQKGIVHRDLKPSNILICLYDGHPVPKVIDFGLAKAMHQPLTEQSIFTGHGVMVGTPLYMSPEQAESNNLDIDTRTDIYSLGVVLYELLTGSTPLERQQLQKAAFDEVLRLIKEVEPPRPSLRLSGSDSLASIAAQRSIDPKQLSRSLSGDLDWISMKALDKERSRRYETANGLARDIERFLNEEPVEACPPSTAYRIRKFIKRYKARVTAATIVLLALVVGIVGTSWGLRMAKIAEEKAVTSEGKTIQALADVTKERDAKEVERQKAIAARGETQKVAEMLAIQKAALELSDSKSKRLLAEAAQSDRLTARNKWEFGEHRDALAYWARSLDYDPISAVEANTILNRILNERWSTLQLTLSGHKSAVCRAAFSPDGTRIVTASKDQSAIVWDSKTGRTLTTLSGHTGRVFSASFSPDGKRIVTASVDKTAKVWDTTTGQSLITLTGHEQLLYLASFSPDGRRIVTASDDGTSMVWDSETGSLILTLSGHGGEVYSAAYSSDGKRIATASEDKTAVIWNAESGERLYSLSGHEGPVYCAVFSPDGTRIATGAEDNTAKVWDAASTSLVCTLVGHHEDINSVAYNQDGTRVVTSSDDKTAKEWDADSGSFLRTIPEHHDKLYSADFSPDGARIVTASDDGKARVWDVSSDLPMNFLSERGETLLAASFSMDGERLLTTSDLSNSLTSQIGRSWDLATGMLVAEFPNDSSTGRFAGFSADGMLAVTTSETNNATVWNVITGRVATTTSGPVGSGTRVVFRPDLKCFGFYADGSSIQMWNSDTGQPHGKPFVHEDLIWEAAFSPDGTRLVTLCNDGTGRLWNAETGDSLLSFSTRQHMFQHVKFSPDNAHFLTTSLDDAKMWDSKTGQIIATLTGHQLGLWQADYSPDGKRIVTVSSNEATARLWDAMSGQPLFTLAGHQGNVLQGVFNLDGTLIATTSTDNTVRLWDSTTGQPIAFFIGNKNGLSNVQFSPDGRRLVSLSVFDERVARIWEVISHHSAPSKWLSDFLRLLAHRNHNNSGEMVDWPSPEEEAQVIAQLRQQISADETRYGDFGRYFLTPGLDKPTYPGSKVSCGEAADRLIRPVALQSEVERAYNWHPKHPLVHIALAKFETEPKRAEFLREYGVSRLLKRQPSPEDSARELTVLCHRAEELLLDQKDQVRADLVHKRAEELASKP